MYREITKSELTCLLRSLPGLFSAGRLGYRSRLNVPWLLAGIFASGVGSHPRWDF